MMILWPSDIQYSLEFILFSVLSDGSKDWLDENLERNSGFFFFFFGG